MATPSLTERLAEVLARSVQDRDRGVAATHLEDWLGAVVAAAHRPEGEAVLAFTRSQRGAGATAVCSGETSEAQAAFHNAALALALELDSSDRQARLHAGPVVIAAALAAAEATDSSGAALLDAVVRGYEAAVRVGRSAGSAHYHYFHPTSTCGGFGAAAAVASVLGLGPAATAHALGIAGTTAGGFWQVRMEPASAKLAHAGRAAESGISGARLAAAGMTAPLRLLEGERGFYAATAPDSVPAALVAEQTDRWLIHDSSLKPWACCRHAHASIDAALELHDQLDGEPVSGATAHVYADALDFCDRVHPTTTGQARFSLQHVLACALVDGRVPLSCFDEPALSRPDIAHLRPHIELRLDREIEAAYPDSWGTRVVVRTPSRVLVASRGDAKGDPNLPMTRNDVREKTAALVAGVSAPHLVEALCEAVGSVREGAPTRDLSHVLRRLPVPSGY